MLGVIEVNVDVNDEVITVVEAEASESGTNIIKTPRNLTIMKKDKILYFDCCEIL